MSIKAAANINEGTSLSSTTMVNLLPSPKQVDHFKTGWKRSACSPHVS